MYSLRLLSPKRNYLDLLRPVKLLDGNSKRHIDIEKSTWTYNEIPGPRALPLVGNLGRYFPVFGDYDPDIEHVFYQKMYEKYGGIVKEKLFGGGNIVHVFNQQDIAQVYETEGPTPLCPAPKSLLKYRRDRSHLYSSAGLLPTNGEEWLRFRELFQDILLAPEVAKALSGTFEDVLEDFMKEISKDVRIIYKDCIPDLLKLSMENFGVMAFNRRLHAFSSDKNTEATNLIKTAMDLRDSLYSTEHDLPIWKFLGTPSYKKLASSQAYLEQVIKKYIDEASFSPDNCESKSVISKMLDVSGATKKDVLTMIMDMFIAGIETTAYMTAFALYSLTCHYSVQIILYNEVVEYLPEKTTRYTDQQWKGLYLDSVIKETLRLFPLSVGVSRVLPTDLTLSNYFLKAGTTVLLHHQVASRQPENYSFPNAFIPTRWIEGSGLYNEPKPHLFRPFGDGPRRCLGKEFVDTQLRMFLTRMVRSFEIQYFYGEFGAVDICTRQINMPDKPMRLLFVPRRFDAHVIGTLPTRNI